MKGPIFSFWKTKLPAYVEQERGVVITRNSKSEVKAKNLIEKLKEFNSNNIEIIHIFS